METDPVRKKDTQSRKYQLTINNPEINHEEIKRILTEFKGCTYYCLADEIGLETKTPHTHVFFVVRSPIRFTTVKKRFPGAHIETAHGTAAENRDYVSKTGKWENDPKADTKVEGSFEEWGELPQEAGQGFRSDIAQIYRQIEDGLSNADIMAANPESAVYINKMDKIRQDILADRFRNDFRELDCTYIWGPTQTFKTRHVMEKYGYGEVYRTTDYKHPFDQYAQEDVMLFDEFRSSLLVGDMLNLLDGYPLALPARYANRQACYTKVYIISNIDLRQQYQNVQREEEETWRAFLRRIHHVIEFRKDAPPIDHGNALEYVFPPPPPEWTQGTFEELKDKDLIL